MDDPLIEFLGDPFVKVCLFGLLLAWATFVIGGIAMALLGIRRR
jgi:hypothetical protein